MSTTNQVSIEAIQAMLNNQAQANGGAVQQLTNEQLMSLINAAAQGQQATTQGVKEQQLTYEYKEIKDLHLPNMDAETKAKAIALANKIEMVKVSIDERQNKFIAVSDVELQDLNAMIKDFRKITGSSFTGMIRNATRGAKVVYTDTVVKAEVKVTQAIDDLGDTAGNVIDGVVALGVETLKFGGVFTKGTLNIGSSAVKGILKTGFNLIK